MTIDITIHPVERVLSALDGLIDDNPELEPTVDFYEELLPVLYEARPDLTGLTLDPDIARLKLGEGVPLLWGEFGASNMLGVEPNVDLFMTLCRLAAEGGNEGGEALMRAMLAGELDLKAVLHQTLVLDRGAMTQMARVLRVDLNLIEAVGRFLLTPITWAYAYAFGQALDYTDWHQGYCPVCGAWPILSELRGRDRYRALRCGRCGASWRFKRLQCLWCNNTHQKELSFLYDPDLPTWRVDVCHYCRGYIKTMTTFDPLDPEMLLVHDLKTMFMDQMAAQEGYQRPYRQPLSEPSG